MLVKDFYNLNRKVFNKSKIDAFSPGLFDDMDIVVLNDLFLDHYANCLLPDDNEEKVQNNTSIEIYKNKVFYDAVKDALSKTFDPTQPINITTTKEDSGIDSTVIDQTPGVSTTYSKSAFDGGALKTTDKTEQSGTNLTTSDITYGKTTTDTKTGYENVDYEKAIRDIYETKRINIYEVVLNHVADHILVLIYFDE